MIYTINFEDVDKLDKKFQTLKSKFKKNGQTLTYKRLGAFFKEDSQGVTRKYIDIEVEGFSKVGSYQVVALIEHGEKVNIIHLLSKEIVLPELYRTTKSTCDHCQINRYRKETVVLFDGQNFKQVGKSCLKEFLGIDVELYALWAQLADGMERISFGGGGKYTANYLDSETVLLLAIEETIEHGYLPRYTTIYDGAYEDRVFNENNTPDKILKFFRTPNSKYQGQYNNLLDWLNTTEQTGFILNIKAIIAEGFVEEKNIAMLACIYKVMQKSIEKEERAKAIAEAKAVSQYVGQVGDKIEVTGNIVEKGRFETMYGITSIYEIIDGGNIFIWFTSNNVEEGVVTLKGTIKEHSEYNDTKQTILTRCKVIKREEKKEEVINHKTNKSEKDLEEFFKMMEE